MAMSTLKPPLLDWTVEAGCYSRHRQSCRLQTRLDDLLVERFENGDHLGADGPKGHLHAGDCMGVGNFSHQNFQIYFIFPKHLIFNGL